MSSRLVRSAEGVHGAPNRVILPLFRKVHLCGTKVSYDGVIGPAERAHDPKKNDQIDRTLAIINNN
jgi:hypothetical protein